MRKYLSEIISTQSARRQENIQVLLDEARTGRERLEVIYERLRGAVSGLAPLQMEEETANGRITSGPTTSNLRQIGLRISEMYRLSNAVSLLLNSHASILSSEVKTLEEELNSMESMISNYAFMLADGKSFDYASLEPFNDYLNFSEEFSTGAPDRSAGGFSARQKAHINKTEGTLVLPRSRAVAYNIYPRVVGSNFVVKTDSLDATTNSDSTQGWRTDYVSSAPITSAVPNYPGQQGAQVILEYEPPEPKAASHIKLAPFSDVPVYVEAIQVFLSEESDPIELLDEATLLDRPKEFAFPINTVARFRVHLNQRTFTRTFDVDRHEGAAQTLQSLSRSIRTRVVHNIEQNRVKETKTKRLSPFGFRDFVDSIKRTISPVYKQTPESSVVFWTAVQSLDEVNESSSILADSAAMATHRLNPVLAPESDPQIPLPKQGTAKNRDGYRYIMGLKSVVLGVTDTSFKGVFVSRALDADGDIGEIRLKAGDKQYVSPNAALDNKALTSVEYSISNSPSPLLESDWEPILPVGVSEVKSERLFPNDFGKAKLRFAADRQEGFRVYKNGLEFNGYTMAYDPNDSINGVNITIGQMSADDVFTVDYVPVRNVNTVKLNEISNFDDLPLTAAFDAGGAGEGFNGTSDRNTVTLKNAPYIDREEALQNSGYSPISVVIGDGKPAINVTDYTNSEASTFPTDDESYYYIQSGRKLLFNTNVGSMRVYYQYLENNVRFRVVLRCNTRDFVSPEVDYVQVKAKIRKPDQSL